MERDVLGSRWEKLSRNAALLSAAVLVALAGLAFAQSYEGSAAPSAGRDFQFACSPCHGPDGTGGGPVAGELKTSPPDLTAIAKRAGGQFPTDQVYERIEGLAMPDAHGSREMPVWGAVFLFEELGGSVSLKDTKKATEATRQRMERLVEYLRSIQR